MRVIAIFPCLCAVVAFMLSILCMFAGNKPGFMQNYDLFTVSMVPYRITSTNNSQLNTSMLGDFLINKTQSSVGGILGSLEGELQTIENDIKNDVNGAIDDIAQALDIHDFYSVHILDYCEGYYEPGPFGNATEAAWKNVTDCSNSTTFFDFDPDQTLQGQLKQGVTLDDLHFPQSVETTIQTAQKAMKAMFILYVIGIACSGLAFIGAVLALFGDGRLGMILNSMIDTASTLIIAFLALGTASAISTILIIKAVNAINQFGADAGIAAYKGNGFLAMTWAATALMLLASIGWLVDCCIGPSRKKRSYV